MGSRWNPDTTYTKHPVRRITRRVVYCSPATDKYPEGYWLEYRIELECGHELDDRGQKETARCYLCGPLGRQTQTDDGI